MKSKPNIIDMVLDIYQNLQSESESIDNEMVLLQKQIDILREKRIALKQLEKQAENYLVASGKASRQKIKTGRKGRPKEIVIIN